MNSCPTSIVDYDNKEKSISRLDVYYGESSAEDILTASITREFAGDIFLFSSFGAQSVLLIDMIAKIDKNLPILFLDTQKHFSETYDYVETLRKRYDLTDIRFIKPDPKLVNNIDSNGQLWQNQPNRCCWLRKVEPLQRAVKQMGVKALITGRKSYQTADRSSLSVFQIDEDGVFRVNPLSTWNSKQIWDEIKKRDLPTHPLLKQGYKSIGCAPCTSPVKEGQDERDGRWAHTINLYGQQKTECGIHVEKKNMDWSI